MKRLLIVLVFVSFLGCVTTNTPPASYNNTEMRSDEPQSEEAKKLGKNTFWMLIDGLIISHALQVWPF